MRYFRAWSDAVYEQARLTLDAAWGFPSNNTRSCFSPASEGIRDAHGRLLLAVENEFCEYTVAIDLLPQLLASGLVEEIDASIYQAAISPELPI
jgi:hypothetical protein